MPLNYQEVPLQPSTLETIDASLTAFVNNTLDIRVQTNKGHEKVPVIWAASERAYQVKQSKDLRNSEGIMILPVIVISRESVSKTKEDKGGVYGWIPNGYLTISKRIQQEKTSNFVNADAKKTYGQVNFKTSKNNEKIVYQHISIPQPIYLKVGYKITLMAEYQQQINDMLLPFLAKPGSLNQLFLYQDGHRYEAFVKEDFPDNGIKDNMAENPRLFKGSVTIDVLGYTVGMGNNQDTPKILIEENAVEVRMQRERLLTDDKIDMTSYAGGKLSGSAVTLPIPVVLGASPSTGPATGG